VPPVTNLPSLPAKGLLLTMNSIDSVGSSISRGGKAIGSSTEATVSPTLMPQARQSHDVAGRGILYVAPHQRGIFLEQGDLPSLDGAVSLDERHRGVLASEPLMIRPMPILRGSCCSRAS